MDWRTRLLKPDPRARRDYTSLATPVFRGSTVVFENAAAVNDHWNQSENGYSYGLYGTPTTLELAARMAELEQAHFSFVVPGGQAAIALVYFAYCTAGSHALVPHSAYGPNKEMAEGLMAHRLIIPIAIGRETARILQQTRRMHQVPAQDCRVSLGEGVLAACGRSILALIANLMIMSILADDC